MIRTKGKFSVVGACEGVIAGLVGITPAAGYVQVWPAALIGLLTGIVCNLVKGIDGMLGIDEGLDAFKLHGIGGMVGSFLTGIFADEAISFLDGETISPGAWNGVGVQVGRQLADICAISLWSFVISCILLLGLKYIPGMNLRVSEEAEMMGLDYDQFVDEQIGDWSMFHDFTGAEASKIQGTTQGGLAVSGASSMERGEVPEKREE